VESLSTILISPETDANKNFLFSRNRAPLSLPLQILMSGVPEKPGKPKATELSFKVADPESPVNNDTNGVVLQVSSLK